ncbi:small nuclear ribonucleo F [Lecanosticta acicola]|uniref:Sm protein F n=1 Tax=Lecanosticta acicola TaxID=111012 RepID=A0AAI8YU29_9PEZI|nr:small nuclear ribonucleo F [Lecanosticta acicola]
MSAFVPLNPRPFLQNLINEDVRIKIKWGQEYTGRLVSVDSYMNVQLANTLEWSGSGKEKSDSLGQVLIRCNNVLWISKAEEGEGGKQQGNGDAEMQG